MELDPFKEKWERQEGESNPMWHCFKQFLTDGRVRHYKRTYRFFRDELAPEHNYAVPSAEEFEKYAVKALWKERAQAFDENQIAERQWLREKAVNDGHDLFVKGHRALIRKHLKRLDTKLEQSLSNIEDDSLHAADVGAIKSAIEYVVGIEKMGEVIPDSILEEGMSAKRLSAEAAQKTKEIMELLLGTMSTEPQEPEDG